MKKISLLGATGSIGTQTLEIVRQNPDKYQVVVITTNQNIDLLAEQAREFTPELIVVNDEQKLEQLKQKTVGLNVEVAGGSQGLNLAALWPTSDLVVSAVVGFSGVYPTLLAVRNGKDIALANKESLVAAGDIITREINPEVQQIIPVDSEHSAIYQALEGEDINKVNKLLITASGGPFFGYKYQDLTEVTPNDALKHPNWNMGSKISIDSATLMNKGLEVIEAHYLFDIEYDDIEVLVHPESIVHSLVEFIDGVIKAELGEPDMKKPINYALSYPNRTEISNKSFSLINNKLTFYPPDSDTFPCLLLAYSAGKTGGTMPCVLNAANEIAVNSFLTGHVSFLEIPVIIKSVMNKHSVICDPSIDDIFEVDSWARYEANRIIIKGE